MAVGGPLLRHIYILCQKTMSVKNVKWLSDDAMPNHSRVSFYRRSGHGLAR
jgi:hypothetical protein